VRLTLRTLLSYLDDMLEPAQAKQIGAKVADSEQARELTERIKQVTRRRRLTTPPASGPGGIDPNTIAEYLDNEVTPEQAAEVEQICLASDVHLAEVAACHQILTLVLGEPALVPPSAKQKMYALVKGPESIPHRKATRSATKEIDQDLSSEIDPTQDETLRLGVAPAGKADNRNLWLLIGGGVLAAALLAVAIWQLLPPSGNNVGPKGSDQHAHADAKDKADAAKVDAGKTDSGKADGEKKQVDASKDNKDKDASKDQVEQKDRDKKSKDDDKQTTDGSVIKVVPVPIKPVREISYKPADMKQQPIGLYLAPNLGEPNVLLAKTDKAGWTRVAPSPMNKVDLNVSSGQPLMSLSGSKSKVILETGIELTLWGNLPEVTLDPILLESRIIVHANAQLDADLTLQRGRLIVKNVNKTKKAIVRLRFENPLDGSEEYFDATMDSGCTIIFERYCELDRNEPFYEDPKDKMRKGPTAIIRVYGYEGFATVRHAEYSESVDDVNQPILQWQNRQGRLTPLAAPTPPATIQSMLPPWFQGTPALKEETEKQARKKAVAASADLAKALNKNPIDVALTEMIEQARKEVGADKRISADTFSHWRHAIRCSASIDNASYLFDEFSSEKTPPIIRGLCLQTLHQWVGLQRDHDEELYKIVLKAHKKETLAVKIMELFHKVSEPAARRPGTYQILIEGLNNELLPIRTLSHWHLFALAPAGNSIPYEPTAPRAAREAAVRAWLQLIPPGQLPPTPKKGKSIE
jgi:hypothetical protein